MGRKGRAGEAPPATTVEDPTLAGFLRFMEENQVDWTGLEIRGGAAREDTRGRAYSVYAKKAIAVDTEIARMPKAAIISSRTTGIRDAIEGAGLVGGMALTLALMYEIALGSKSPWAGYIAIMPSHEPTLLYWSEEELAELEGTELEGQAARDRADLTSDYEAHIAPLVRGDARLACLPVAATGIEAYTAAASLVASRSFGVDDWHGEAMVPLADMFNHKTAGEHIHFMDEDSDDEEGTSEGPEGDDGDEAKDEEEEEEGGGGGEGGPAGPVGGEAMVFGVVRPAKAGDEVYNTYGELSTGALIHRYSFADVADNPYNVVNIDGDVIAAALREHATPAQLKAAKVLAKKHDEVLGPLPYYEVRGDGSVDPDLLLRLHSALAEEGAREQLLTMLEDDGGDDDVEHEIDEEAMLTPPVCRVLADAIAARRARYPKGGDRASAEAALRRAEREGASARIRAARMLRLGELLVLERAADQVGRRLGGVKKASPPPGGGKLRGGSKRRRES